MWQTVIFFFVVNALSGFMAWSKTKDMPFKISKFNMILYTFIGGAMGILIASVILKYKIFKSSTLLIALIENVGVYTILYEMAIRVR